MRFPNSPLDHPDYIERRLSESDDAVARLDVVVAQATRKAAAISEAVRRIERVSREIESGQLPRAALCELLGQVVTDLQSANLVRSTDPTPEHIRNAARAAGERATAAAAGEGSR